MNYEQPKHRQLSPDQRRMQAEHCKMLCLQARGENGKAMADRIARRVTGCDCEELLQQIGDRDQLKLTNEIEF